MNALVAYFSRAGENYVGGVIKELPVGNTEVVARIVVELTGAALYKIEPAFAYPKDYSDCLDEASLDQRRVARPALKAPLPDTAPYTVIYLGFPNYWGTMPMPVFTFLEGNDFGGKIIRPFCTHEGSGFGRSLRDIQIACPGAGIEKGLAIHGVLAARSTEEIREWLKGEIPC